MSKKLLVQQFIDSHPTDWEKLLSEKPYCLAISRDTFNGQDLVMLKYSQIDSDFNEQIVRECRGLILDASTFDVVSFPFKKFGNYSEGGWVDKIDWKTAKTTEKIDGSLIKIVNVGDNLLVSTNGTILASKAPVAEQIGCRYSSFGDIVAEVLDNVAKSHGLQEKMVNEGLSVMFEEGYTYMFELVSPWTRVVVPHHENDLYFLGCRNNETFEETFFGDHPLSKVFKTPKIFPLKSIDDCLAAAKDLPWDQEGYVVVDSKFHRNKVKSIAYLAAHHLKNNGVMSYARAVDLVRLNEVDEVLAYFPEFKDALLEVKSRYEKLVDEVHAAENELAAWIKANGYDTQPWWIESGGQKRKDLACWVMSSHKSISGMLFGIVDKKVESAAKFLESIPADKLVKMLGYKDNA